MDMLEMIDLINKGHANAKGLAKELNIKESTLKENFKEIGYEWSFKERKYIYNEALFNEEIAITIEEESNNKSNIKSIDESNIEIKSNIESKFESNNEINFAIDEIFSSLCEKPKFVPINTHLRIDINEALNKFAKDNPRGAKQELINRLLEIALKRSNYL